MPAVKRETNTQCPCKICVCCKRFQNKAALQIADDKIVCRQLWPVEDDEEKDTEIIKDANFMSQNEYHINCPRCKITEEHTKNVPNIVSNNVIGVCDHCRVQENLRHKFHEKPTRQIELKHINDTDSNKRVKTWLSKIQHSIKNAQLDKTETNMKNRVYSCLEFNKLYQSSPRREPLVEELLFYQEFDSTRSTPITDRSCLSRNKENIKTLEHHKNYNKEVAVTLLLPDNISHEDDGLPGATYGSHLQKDNQFRGLSHESLEHGFAQYDQQEIGIIEHYSKAFYQKTVKPIAETTSDDSTLPDGNKEHVKKELETQSRKYCSQESLFTDFSNMWGDQVEKDFTYLFPQLSEDDLPTRNKTSSELILDAKAAQQKAQEGRRKRDEELQRKRDRHENVKSNKVKKIRQEIISSTDDDLSKTQSVLFRNSEDGKEQEIDGADNLVIQTESFKDLKPIKVQKLPRKVNREEQSHKIEKYEEKSVKSEKLKNVDRVQKRVMKKDEEKNKYTPANEKKILADGKTESSSKGKRNDISEGKVNDGGKKNKTKANDKNISPDGKTESSSKGKHNDIAEEKVNDGGKKKSTKTNDKNTSPDGKTESSSKGKKNVGQTGEMTMKQIKIIKTDYDDDILNLVKLHKMKPKILEEAVYRDRKFEMKKHHKYYRCDIKPVGSKCTESESDFSLFLKKDDQQILDVIKGEKIIMNKACLPVKETETEEIPPILFKSFFKEQALHEDNLASENQLVKRLKTPHEEPSRKGVIRYALSDPTFIDKGWTLLPTEKVVRKINVYRMRPARPEFDWFEHNKSKGLMQYESGEKLAEFDDNGRGRWYYRNGRLALDYYDAEEVNAQQRFVLYSSGEPDERGRPRPFTILATFDYLGNGIVFDHAGKIRLKYNQTEGVVLDRSIGPVSHWKWHALNDPPVLQQVMIDTQLAHKDTDILNLGNPLDDKPRQDNEEMLNIEFDNFVKEKSRKLSQNFKPYQIKMKALKINEQFSLRVLDQATIYLIFRDGSTNMKLNIGMVLDHHEIIDTDTAEVGEVSNSFDRLPARTNSIAAIQEEISRAQRIEQVRIGRLQRHRPTVPKSSADRLIAGISRPLRPQILQTAAANSAVAGSRCYCKCRKPIGNSLYYDTRLV